MTDGESKHRVWKQRTEVCILGSPIHKWCDLGNHQLQSPVKHGPHMGGADERIFVKVPSPDSTMLTGAVSVGPGGKVTIHSQIPTGTGPWRLKAPGVADAQDTPSLIGGDLNPTRRREPKIGSWGSASEALMAVPLSTCPIGQVCARALEA